MFKISINFHGFEGVQRGQGRSCLFLNQLRMFFLGIPARTSKVPSQKICQIHTNTLHLLKVWWRCYIGMGASGWRKVHVAAPPFSGGTLSIASPPYSIFHCLSTLFYLPLQPTGAVLANCWSTFSPFMLEGTSIPISLFCFHFPSRWLNW